MGNKGFIKRILPFFATFAVGVFIASFFVTIKGPGFSRGGKCRHEARRLMMENEALRNENLRLQNELDGRKMNSSAHDPSDFDGVLPLEMPADIEPPPVPAAPRARK